VKVLKNTFLKKQHLLDFLLCGLFESCLEGFVKFEMFGGSNNYLGSAYSCNSFGCPLCYLSNSGAPKLLKMFEVFSVDNFAGG
jgi:hypothetical protein